MRSFPGLIGNAGRLALVVSGERRVSKAAMDRMEACTVHPVGQWDNNASMLLLIVAGDERKGGHLYTHTSFEIIPNPHRPGNRGGRL